MTRIWSKYLWIKNIAATEIIDSRSDNNKIVILARDD